MKATMKRKKRGQLPQLCRKKNRNGRDTAYGTFNGCRVWFGHWGEPETRVEFDAYLARWLANGRRPLDEPEDVEGLTVGDLVDRYRRHLDAKHDDAWHSNNEARVKGALDPLALLFGTERAAEFGPRKLVAVRAAMIQRGKLCRYEINKRVQGIRRCFGWATAQEFVSPLVIKGLDEVEPLRPGEFGVREGKKRGPVPEDVYEATLPYLAPVPRALVELLWWTGARPSELFNLRPCDVDRGDDVWTARLDVHKTKHHGRGRALDFGPKAQEILRRYLDRVPRPAADAPLFSPKLAMAEHRAEKRSRRETPLWDSHLERYERERARRASEGRSERLGDRYDATTLRKAIERAVRRANRDRGEAGEKPLPRWTPYQLRHAALTRIRKALGLEAAKAIGGHATAIMTEGYSHQAERDLARRVAGQLG